MIWIVGEGLGDKSKYFRVGGRFSQGDLGYSPLCRGRIDIEVEMSISLLCPEACFGQLAR